MAASDLHHWHTFTQGTKVLDTQTGLDGVVVSTKLTQGVVPAAAPAAGAAPALASSLPNPVTHETVVVKLESGDTVERSPRTLVAL